MATFAIGDIHGNHAALDDLLRQITPEVGTDDVVVFLGDYIDRGRNSKECVQAILTFRNHIAAEVVCLCGNHEDWMLRTLRNPRQHRWLLGMDGFDTVRSYSAAAEKLILEAKAQSGADLYGDDCPLPYDAFFDAMPAQHIEFFQGLRLSYQGPDCVCTHGGLDPCVPAIEAQTDHALIWGVNGFPTRYEGVDTIVYGHWHNAVLDDAGWPLPAFIGNTIGIDTIAHGVLTAIRMPDRKLFQSARRDG